MSNDDTAKAIKEFAAGVGDYLNARGLRYELARSAISGTAGLDQSDSEAIARRAVEIADATLTKLGIKS